MTRSSRCRLMPALPRGRLGSRAARRSRPASSPPLISLLLNLACWKSVVRRVTASPREVSSEQDAPKVLDRRLARRALKAVAAEHRFHPRVRRDHGPARVGLGLEVVDRVADRRSEVLGHGQLVRPRAEGRLARLPPVEAVARRLPRAGQVRSTGRSTGISGWTRGAPGRAPCGAFVWQPGGTVEVLQQMRMSVVQVEEDEDDEHESRPAHGRGIERAP